MLYGANYADLVLLHSDAGGADGTWTSEIIWDSPLENYTAAAGQTTDYDADGDFDTILTTDGNYDMLMTDDGTLHVFAGTMYILDNNIAAGYSYFPTVGGILYWKTGVTGMYYLDVVIDWKNDDGLDDPYAGIGQSFASYGGESFTTLTSSAYDPASGRIYLTYTMPVEYTDQLGDPTAAAAESKNDLFGIYSDDKNGTEKLTIDGEEIEAGYVKASQMYEQKIEKLQDDVIAGIDVELGVKVCVASINCFCPQLDITKLMTKTRIALIFVFIGFSLNF